jgi:transcriptional regulator with XRE-family HTH domain
MKSKKPTSREVIAALIRLNNISQGKVADLAGLVRPNVSSWLCGRIDALSMEKQLKLFDVLGVSYGRLRHDGVHRWCVREVEEVALVLGEVLDDEERAHAEFWHIHNTRYPGCIVLKVVKPAGSIWVVMYRPMMAEPPQPINAESLRLGVDQGDVIIDTETWESWLPPAVLEPISFGTQITKLIERFPYPLPPQEYYDQMEEDGTEGNQDQPTERLVLTPEDIQNWDLILFQAQDGGKDFDEIVKATRKALGISLLKSK